MLILGWIMIKRKNIILHVTFMLSAVCFSTLFLGCYLYYHYQVGHVPFQGTGLPKTIYFLILFSHLPLAIINLPMILMTLYYAKNRNIEKHKSMARKTLPIWLYVSVTGVLVYLMCHVWYKIQ
jgi:uncharacterized membrane protein YozB (DUF420 family)